MCTHKLSQATRASEAREGIENPKVSIPAENPCAGVYTQDTRKTPPGCVRRGVASEAREREDVRQRPEREKMCVRSQTERRCGLEVLHTRHIANGWRCSKVLQKDEPPSFTPTASTHTDRQNVCSDDRVADRPDRILISLFSG